MKLLITSDVHGHEERLKEVIDIHKDVDAHLNAGDMCLDQRVYEKYHLITVKGNNDFFTNEPFKRVINLFGIHILLTHGHMEHVKFSKREIKALGEHLEADLVVFGHTHQRYIEKIGDMVLINPGALGDFEKSYAIYEDGEITFYQL